MAVTTPDMAARVVGAIRTLGTITKVATGGTRAMGTKEVDGGATNPTTLVVDTNRVMEGDRCEPTIIPRDPSLIIIQVTAVVVTAQLVERAGTGGTLTWPHPPLVDSVASKLCVKLR